MRMRPEYIKEIIEGIKKENNIASDDELQQQLRREGMSLDDLKRNIERSIMRRQLLSRELESKVAVSDDEVRADYEARRAEYDRPGTLHLQEIVVKTQSGSQALATDLVRRARAGEDFAELARAYSAAPTASAGGDLGRLSREDLSPEIAKVAFALPVGGVSEPLPTPEGFRILKVVEKTEASQVPFEEVKAEIQKRLSAERATREYEAYMEGLRKEAIIDVRVREVPLQAAVPATPGLEMPGAGAAPARARGEPRVRDHHHAPGPTGARGARAACRRPRHRPGRPSCLGRRAFFVRVYEAVRCIPRGRVATYGQVAALAGTPRGARAVGWALRALKGAAAAAHPLASGGGGGRAPLAPRGGRGSPPAPPPAGGGRGVPGGPRGPAPARPAMIPAAARGTLDQVDVPAILRALVRADKTGPLRFTRGRITKTVYLSGGRLIFATSTDPDDRLGEMLLRKGLISYRDLEESVQAIRQGKRQGTHTRGERDHPLPRPRAGGDGAGPGDRLQPLPLGGRRLRVRGGRPALARGDPAAHVHGGHPHGGHPPRPALEPDPGRGGRPRPALHALPRLHRHPGVDVPLQGRAEPGGHPRRHSHPGGDLRRLPPVRFRDLPVGVGPLGDGRPRPRAPGHRGGPPAPGEDGAPRGGRRGPPWPGRSRGSTPATGSSTSW